MGERIRGKLLPGFPQKGKFQTKEEVDAYFATDKIQCLLCGKWFKKIGGMHLTFKHGFTADDYKEMFGLPWLRGLGGALNYEKNVKAGKRKYAKRDKEQMVKILRSGKPSPPRTHQPFRRDFATRLGVSMKGRSNYRPEDFEAVLERMREQERTMNDVCGDPDMPSGNTWRIYIKKHPELKEKYRETLYELPYPLQAASRDLSPRFSIDCRDLRARGMNMKKIAESLGVTPHLVRRVLRDAPGGFRPLDRRSPTKWRLKDFEAGLDRMRKQQRTLNDVCGDPDLPSTQIWREIEKRHPDFEKKAREIQSHFSYPLQSRTGCVSTRFIIDCQRLRAGGMRLSAIAHALGLSRKVVKRTMEESQGGCHSLEDDVWSKWLPRDYEAVLDRMRDQRRLLGDVCDDPDMPPRSSFRRYEKKHTEFQVKIMLAYDSLPFFMQIKSPFASPRLEMECRRRKAGGMGVRKIAQTLGVRYAFVKWATREDHVIFHPLKKKETTAAPRIWRTRDFEAVLDRMRKEKRGLVDVCNDPDLPSHALWTQFRKKHPEFDEKYRRVVFSLPYSMQIKVGILSPRLILKCRRMRTQGKTRKEIAADLGISLHSVRTLIRRIEKEEKKSHPEHHAWKKRNRSTDKEPHP